MRVVIAVVAVLGVACAASPAHQVSARLYARADAALRACQEDAAEIETPGDSAPVCQPHAQAVAEAAARWATVLAEHLRAKKRHQAISPAEVAK